MSMHVLVCAYTHTYPRLARQPTCQPPRRRRASRGVSTPNKASVQCPYPCALGGQCNGQASALDGGAPTSGATWHAGQSDGAQTDAPFLCICWDVGVMAHEPRHGSAIQQACPHLLHRAVPYRGGLAGACAPCHGTVHLHLEVEQCMRTLS